MPPIGEDYGSATDFHLVIDELAQDVTIEITEDNGRDWFSLRDSEERKLDEV